MAAAIPIAAIALGTAQKAHAAREQGKLEESVARRNAATARIKADEARRRGEVLANRRRTEGRARVASQRAGFAAQGIVVNTGTALEVQEAEDRLTDEDVIQIRNNAALDAWGFDTQAQEADFGAKTAKFNRRQAVSGAILGGFTGALSAGLAG